MIPSLENMDKSNIQSEDRKLIDHTLEICSRYVTSQLVEISHKQAPWRNAYVPGMSNVITKNSILKYVGG